MATRRQGLEVARRQLRRQRADLHPLITVPRELGAYQLVSANDIPGRDPDEWSLEQQNNDGTYTLLERVSVSAPTARYQPYARRVVPSSQRRRRRRRRQSSPPPPPPPPPPPLRTSPEPSPPPPPSPHPPEPSPPPVADADVAAAAVAAGRRGRRAARGGGRRAAHADRGRGARAQLRHRHRRHRRGVGRRGGVAVLLLLVAVVRVRASTRRRIAWCGRRAARQPRRRRSPRRGRHRGHRDRRQRRAPRGGGAAAAASACRTRRPAAAATATTRASRSSNGSRRVRGADEEGRGGCSSSRRRSPPCPALAVSRDDSSTCDERAEDDGPQSPVGSMLRFSQIALGTRGHDVVPRVSVVRAHPSPNPRPNYSVDLVGVRARQALELFASRSLTPGGRSSFSQRPEPPSTRSGPHVGLLGWITNGAFAPVSACGPDRFSAGRP